MALTQRTERFGNTTSARLTTPAGLILSEWFPRGEDPLFRIAEERGSRTDRAMLRLRSRVVAVLLAQMEQQNGARQNTMTTAATIAICLIVNERLTRKSTLHTDIPGLPPEYTRLQRH